MARKIGTAFLSGIAVGWLAAGAAIMLGGFDRAARIFGIVLIAYAAGTGIVAFFVGFRVRVERRG